MISKQEARPVNRNVIRFQQALPVIFGLLLTALEFPGHAASTTQTSLPPEIVSFIQDKESSARALAQKLGIKVSPDIWAYFRTAQNGSTTTTTNAFERLKKRASQYEGSRDDPAVGSPIWQPVMEVELAVEAFAGQDSSYSMDFGRGVLNSLPPGSIYFGGTDSGRGIVTALSKSHEKGDPIFTLTQNALADQRYLDYLQAIYGNKIRIPTTNDSQNAFQKYLADAQKRLEHDRKFPDEPRQIKPGETVTIIDNRVQVSGQVAVMSINGLLAKVIFDTNPAREFYLEESFPLDWMYPHLSPHGFIFKLNREPLAALSDEVVAKDRQFWIGQQTRLIGGWLTPDTTVQEVCAFVRKTFGRKDFSDFEGDRRFVGQSYANKLYSKLRSSIAGLYHWRIATAKTPAGQERMSVEADFAFRQAFALDPHSPDAVFRYVNLLVSARRLEDAFRVAATAQSLDPTNTPLENLVSEVNRMKQAKDK